MSGLLWSGAVLPSGPEHVNANILSAAQPWGRLMRLIVRPGVMLARRKRKSRDLAAAVGIAEQIIGLLKSARVKGVVGYNGADLRGAGGIPEADWAVKRGLPGGVGRPGGALPPLSA